MLLEKNSYAHKANVRCWGRDPGNIVVRKALNGRVNPLLLGRNGPEHLNRQRACHNCWASGNISTYKMVLYITSQQPTLCVSAAVGGMLGLWVRRFGETFHPPRGACMHE